MAPQGGLQASSGTYLTDPNADFNTTARSMLDPALQRWFKELSSGGGNGIIYIRWQHHVVSGNRWKDTACFGDHPSDAEGDKLNQLKGLEWGPILDTATRLTNAAKFSHDEIAKAISNVSLQVERAWPDKNGELAVDKINALSTAGTKFIDTATQLGAHLNTFCVESKKCIQKIVDFAGGSNDDFFNNYLANDDHVDISHFSYAIDYIDIHLRTGKTNNGKEYNLEKARSNERDLEIYSGMGTWYSDVEKGRLDNFCDKYKNAVSSLRRLISEAHETINGHLQTMMNGCSGLDFKPYGNLEALAGAGDKPAEKEPEEKKPQEKEPEQGGQDRNGNGSTSTSGSQQPSKSGNEYTGYTPPAETDADSPAATTPDPTKTDPGTTPSGQTPGVDPVTGKPEPGQPDTGQPGAPGSGQPETVTIQDGDREIAVQSPDGQGHVKLTVDDGTGSPKTYDLDFSAATGQQPAVPDATAGQFGPTGQQPQPLPANGQVPGSTPGADGVHHAQAGPDGKVVVHDGNVTITAEHPPGAPDQVQLTIDDGTGKPTSYLLDYGDPTDPQSQVLPEPAVAQQQGFAGTGQPEPAIAQQQGFAGQPEPAVAQQQGFAAQPLETAAPAAAQHAQSFSAEPLQPATGPVEPLMTTQVQSVAMDFSGGSDAGVADTTWSTQGDLLADSGQDQVAPAGDAGLAAVPDSGGGQHQQGPGGGAMGGGMPMMGGMGAGGAGGGDQERSGGQWSVQGDLFSDTPSAGARIAGVLDDEPGYDR